MKRRQEFTVFSMSFLDTICCAFGAIILLFMLSKFGEPKAMEQARLELEGQIVALNQELNELRGEVEVLNRDLLARQEQVSEERSRIARLRGDLSDIQGRYAASRQESEVANQIEGQLVAAQQSLTEEMKRLLGSNFRRRPDDSTIGGIPIDSEYVIFIIDTSGSMFNYAWPLMLQKVEETLNVYPQLKGFQVTNDVGTHMFPTYQGKWIPDSPTQRKTVIDRLRNWNAFSASNPAGGIVEAIRTYYSRDRKISLYVFGDEFTGPSIDSVIRTVDLINREDQSGERRVRIHAIGFPVRPDAPQYTSIRFATLMRILCARNGGTFVGLDDPARGPGRIRLGQAGEGESPPVPAVALAMPKE